MIATLHLETVQIGIREIWHVRNRLEFLLRPAGARNNKLYFFMRRRRQQHGNTAAVFHPPLDTGS
jgi:hypothetical protein